MTGYKRKVHSLKKFDDRPPPFVNEERIRKDLLRLDRDSFDDRVRRIAFLEALLFKKPTHQLLPQIAFYYFEEAKASFVFSNFAATIVFCQLTAEEVLKAPYRARGNTKLVNDFNFIAIIDKARDDGFISVTEADELQSMRKFRNFLEHPKDYSDKRMLIFSTALYPGSEVEKTAEKYLKLTVELMHSWMKRMRRFRG